VLNRKDQITREKSLKRKRGREIKKRNHGETRKGPRSTGPKQKSGKASFAVSRAENAPSKRQATRLKENGAREKSKRRKEENGKWEFDTTLVQLAGHVDKNESAVGEDKRELGLRRAIARGRLGGA